MIKLLGFKFLKDPGERDANGSPNNRYQFMPEDDLEVCSYYLQTLSSILRYSTESTMASLAKEKVIFSDDNVGKIFTRRETPHTDA